MGGVSRKKLLLYAVLIVGLVAANLWRLAGRPDEEIAAAISRNVAPATVPDLAIDLGPASQPNLGVRDLFRAGAAPEPKPVVVAATAPEPVQNQPDPLEIARDQATKRLDEVRLIGVLASGDGALAVFEHDGNTLSRFVGDEIVSGFRLDRVSQGEVRARHERLGLVAILSLGGAKPMQMTRVE